MSESEQVQHFASELRKVLHRVRAEYSMTAAAVIGTLEIVKLELFDEVRKNRENDPP